MGSELRNRWNFKNLFFRGAAFEVNHEISSLVAGATLNRKIACPNLLEIILPATTYTVTDTGTTTGGYLAIPLFTLPSTRVSILNAFLELTIISCGAEITQTATLNLGVGTTATADSTIASGEVNILAAATQALTAGAAVKEMASSTTMLQLDGTSATVVYLNIGVLDANISANSTMRLSAVLRMTYLDLSGGR